MEHKRDTLGFFSIRAGIVLELAGATMWKISTYFSKDTVGCLVAILLLAITGFYMFRSGSGRLMNNAGSYKGFEWDDGFSRSSIMMTVALLLLIGFLLLYLALGQYSGIMDLKHKLAQLVGRTGGMMVYIAAVFCCVDFAIYNLFGAFIKCMQEIAGVRRDRELRDLLRKIWYQFIWLLCIAGFTYILLYFTGDSRATPIENAIISIIFLGTHWYMGGVMFTTLDKLEFAIEQEGDQCLAEAIGPDENKGAVLTGRRKGTSPKEKAMYISFMLILMMSGAISIIRFSSEKDFICYPYNEGVILGQYIGDRSRVKVPEHIDGKVVVGLGGSFSDSQFIHSVKLPDSLRILGDSTFEGCKKLDRIVLPRDLEYIGARCFYSSNLSILDENNSDVQIIGVKAFDGTPWYSEQKQNNDMVLIGGNLIYYNAVGEIVYIPDGPQVIMEGALDDNANGELNVRELYLPASLEVLGDKVFADFYHLADIHIPESVCYMSEYALYKHNTWQDNDEAENVVIWGMKGSVAEKRGRKEGFLFCEEGMTRPVTKDESAFQLGDLSVYSKEKNVCIICPQEEASAVNGILGDKYTVIQQEDSDMYGRRIREGFSNPCAADILVYDLKSGRDIRTYPIKRLQKFLEARGAVDGKRYELKTGIVEGCYQYQKDNFIYLALKQEDRFLIIDIDADRMNVIDYDELAGTALQYTEEAVDYGIKLEAISTYDWLWESGNSIIHVNGFGSLNEYALKKADRVLEVDSYSGMRGDQFGIAEILTLSSSLPERNEDLYEMFPVLKKVKREDDEMVLIWLDGYMEPLDILKLFMEEGEKISFQDCILSEEHSYDGKKHPIFSIEDYYRYRSGGYD